MSQTDRNRKETFLKKPIRKVTLVLLAVLALVSWRVWAAKAKESTPQVWTPSCIASVPRSWGMYKGGSAQSGLAFEDSAGTLRFLTNLPCDGSAAAVALQIRRTGNLNVPNE
jgi:hypothetical protein